jgi:hypothetical protein
MASMGLWTLLPTSLWAYIQTVAALAFEIYAVWYLSRSEMRETFRLAKYPPFVNADQA